ncbi:hypothetical protein PUNSTDRAFT_140834 [Punctularia strigosozonata HHB-11173 SS5]|uniref:uncharacterized protein n=1 Tax=Punctularia strigosozonata (strain HHB-11173) TaxID=741275 RepID=UPI00044169F6|nr:uncharacterized protein PUNSTDRAFT_140834 [Punctularia strigosozonata HHB-11173 SS5]EIN14581.1 hypothetical protein PUNSTDRAFT_140834 [Punctularia strigosozonata HHB-11173 SS5]
MNATQPNGNRRVIRLNFNLPRRASRNMAGFDFEPGAFDQSHEEDDLSAETDWRWSREPSPAPDVPTRHPKYYIDEGNVVFLVENRLLKIHRFFLTRESDFFQTLFTLPPPEGVLEGSSDTHPIHLGENMNITLKQIEAFLNYIYQGMHDDRRVSLSEWTALLSIASRLDCRRMKRRALREIESADPPMDPIQRIRLATEHDVSEWLRPAYEAICQREDAISPDEAEQIGARTTALLAMARELVRARPPMRMSSAAGPSRFHHPTLGWIPVGARIPGGALFEPEEVTRVVNEVFGRL